MASKTKPDGGKDTKLGKEPSKGIGTSKINKTSYILKNKLPGELQKVQAEDGIFTIEFNSVFQ
jgi:hypothetical protein